MSNDEAGPDPGLELTDGRSRAIEAMVDATFRNGTITAFGVTVSFSLAFLSQWTTAAGEWDTYDIPPVILLFVGVALQIRALALLLPIEGLVKTTYDKATQIYLWGLSLSGLGVFGAVLADLFTSFIKLTPQ